MLVTVTLPVTSPADAGAKVTFRIAICAGARVCPTGTPLTPKPGPEMLTFVMLALAVPELTSVTARMLLLPIVMLPKLNVVGVSTSVAVPVEVEVEVVPVLPVVVLSVVLLVVLVLVVLVLTAGAAKTVRVAAELAALPAEFTTTTANCDPLSMTVVGGVM